MRVHGCIHCATIQTVRACSFDLITLVFFLCSSNMLVEGAQGGAFAVSDVEMRRNLPAGLCNRGTTHTCSQMLPLGLGQLGCCFYSPALWGPHGAFPLLACVC